VWFTPRGTKQNFNSLISSFICSYNLDASSRTIYTEEVQIMLGLNIFVEIHMSILSLKLFIKKMKMKTIPSESTKEQVGEVHVWKFTILVRKNKKMFCGEVYRQKLENYTFRLPKVQKPRSRSIKVHLKKTIRHEQYNHLS
jgi:hypothetical protein